MADNHSISSSKASSASARGRTATTFFSQTFPVFPFLYTMESDLPSSATALGLIIQFFQMLAFVINPHINHGESLEAISQIVYTSHLPFWDPAFVSSTTFSTYTILFWIDAGLIFIWVVSVFYHLATAGPNQATSPLFVSWRVLLHLMSTILYIPLLQGLLSMMVCNRYGMLWTLPDTQCYQGITLVMLIAGIVAVILLFLVGLIAQTSLFDQDPASWKILSRAHVNLDVIALSWKTLSCILFHILLSKEDQGYWFPMYILFSSTIFTIAVIMLAPYYRQDTNRYVASAGLILAATGLLSYLSSVEDGAGVPYYTEDVEGFLFFGGVAVLFRIGCSLADIRVNPELLASLPSVVDAEAPPTPRNFLVFPSGLPVFDLASQENRDLVADIAEQSAADPTSNFFEDLPDPLLTPFITRIFFDTDIELATRFIRCASNLGGLYNKKPVLMLASRIFTKGLTRFHANGKVIVALAHMISAFGEKQSLALMQAERIHRVECSFATRYHSYKLQVQLKVELNVRDANYQKMCDQAKKLHKETLMLMNQFWLKLCVDQVDVAHLAALSTIITQKRHDGNKTFHHALEYRSNDRGLLTKYAGFLDQVMIEPEKAEMLRVVTKNEAEERRRNAMRGARAGGNSHDQAISDVLSMVIEDSSSSSRDDNKVANRFAIFAVLFMLLLTATGFILFAILTTKARHQALNCVDHAGQARALAAENIFLTLEYLTSPVRNTSLNYPILNAISSTADDYLAMHNHITTGGEGGSTAAGSAFLHSKQVLMRNVISPNAAVIVPETFWGAGFEIAQKLVSIVPTIAYYNNGSDGNTEYGTVSMAMLSDTVLQSSLWFGEALNSSVTTCVSSYDAVNNQSIVALSVLFAAFVALSFVVIVLLTFSSSQVLLFKQSILSLFPLIPRHVLEKMAQQSKERVDSYDEQEEEEDIAKSGRLHEDDIMASPGASSNSPSASSPQAEVSDEAAVRQRLLPKSAQDGNSVAKGNVLDDDEDTENNSIHSNVFSFSFVLILLQVALLVICAVNVGTITDAVSKWNFAQQRFERSASALHYHSLAIDSIDDFFQTAESTTFQEAAVNLQLSTNKLADVMSLLPTEREISYLRPCAEAAETVSKTHLELTAMFFGNASNLLTFSSMPASAPVNPTGELARFQLFDPHGTAFGSRAAFASTIPSMQQVIRSDADETNKGSGIYALAVAELALSATIVVAFVAAIYFLRNNAQFSNSPMRVLVLLAVVASTALLAISVVLLLTTAKLESDRNKLLDQTALNTEVTASVNSISRTARAFTQSGQRIFYNKYFDTLSHYFLDVYGGLSVNHEDDLPPSAFSSWFSGNATAQELFDTSVAELQRLQLIAIRLAAASYGVSPFVEVRNVTWNFDLEADAEAVRVEYLNEPLRYTNNSADLVLPSWQQVLIARYTVFSPRYHALLDTVQSVIHYHFLQLQVSTLKDIANDENMITSIDGANMALSIIALVSSIVYLVTVFARAIEANQKGARNLQSGGAGASNSGASSGSSSQSTLGIRASLLGLIAIVIVVFVVGMFGIMLNSENAHNIDLAVAREWHIGRALTASNRFMMNLTDTPFLALQGQLIPILGDLQNNALNLYFTSSGYNIIGSAADLDAFLFTSDQKLSPEFACGYTPASSLTAIEILHRGASAAYSKFGRIVEDIISSTSSADATLNIMRLRRLGMPLLAAMRQSSNLLLKNQNTQIDAFFAALIVTSAFLVVFLIVVVIWVVIPALQRLASEQAGSKLLLRLIPPSVRESVPAIAEFLDTELQGESQKGGTNENSSDSSTFPVVAIDSRGIVLKFNLAAEGIFGYTAAEVIGNNVSILMPDRIAKNHDGFLSAYRRTGIRHVIGYDRQVHAKQKSGELFPIELSIKEFKRDNGEYLFFGFIKDITKNLELKRTEQLNNLVQEYATVPMIAIDSLGTVLRFNKAAEECFGQPSADVVNHNIKMLMPEDVAARHDSYLAAYLRTREKHVIDTARRVFGLRKSGETFPLEINVKEITTSDFGAMSTYLGFCRDLTADLILDEANRVNDEVADLSPIPIIGIDPYGKVLKFSAAACKVFGYEANEVLDKNVKMLMPETVAELHDGYLEAFRHTGKKKVVGTERELIGKRKDGTQIILSSNIREVRKEGQALGTFVGYFIDLSDAKKNEVFKALDDAIVELHQTPLLAMDSLGTIQRVNKALLQEFGYRREELLDKNVRLLMPADVSAKHDGYLQRYMETRVAKVIGQTRRMNAKRKIGTIFPVELKIDEVIDNDGKSSFIGFLRNLTAELHTESQYLINSTIMDISISPMIGIDSGGIIRVFSKAAEVAWKRKAEQVIGQNVKILMPDYYAKNHDMFLEKYMRTKVKNIIDTIKIAEGIDSTGKIFPVELAVREVVQGQDSFFVAYCRDMTRDGQAQQVIRRNDQISDLSPLPLLQIDLYGVVLQYNAAAQAEFQWRRDEVLGRNIKMLLPDEIAKNHDNYLANYRKTKIKNVIGSLRRSRGKRKDGSTFAVEISVNEVVVEGDGERNTYIGYIRDITEELRLIKANEVSGVISDLSPNPLVAINSKGIIISFNRAAAEAFRFADQGQALNQNVKILMPDEIAVRHDGFLTAYAKTKQKHVVDTTRAVKGKRQDGTFFPVEISVREINKEGKEATFLSYIRDCTEDLQIEHATKVSEAVQTLSSVPMITIDRVGKIIRVNRAAPTMFGYPDENDLIGKNVKMLMPNEIAVNHDRYLSSYLQTGVKRVIDSSRSVRAKRADGTEFPAEISVREIKIDAKESLYIGYLQDITSKLELNRLRMVNDAISLGSPVPLIVIDPHGVIKLFSPAAEEFFGYKLNEVLERNVKMLMPESIARTHDQYLANYLKTKEKHVIDSSKVVQARLKTGELVSVELTIKELPAKDGQVNYVGYVQDVRSQFAVERAVTMTDALREMMTLAIICMDDIGTIRQYNRAAANLFGYTKEEVIGNNVKMLMPREVANVHDGYLERYRQTGIKHVVDSSRNVTGIAKDGHAVHIELQVSEFKENGRSVFVSYAIDRTAEIQIAQSAQIADALVSLSAVPIVVINAQNKIQRFNVTAEQQFGWSADEVIGKNVAILMPDEVAVNHDKYVSRYRNHGGESAVIDKKIEVVAKRKDGSTFPAELTVKEVAKLGRDSSFVGYLRDIGEDLVFRSNAIMCSAIESLVPDPIIVINENGIVQTFTPPACEVFGYSKEEVLGQNIKMLMPLDVAQMHDGFLKKYLTTGVRHVVGTTRRVNARRKNGQLVEVELRIRELVAGSMRYYVGYVRDCTKDYQLAMETEIGGAIMELNPDAIITIDPKGTVQKFNSTAEKLFDFDRKHIIGRNVKVLMPDNIATRHDQYLAAYLKSKVKRVINGSRTVTAERKNGDTFSCEISVREVCDDDGEPMFYIGYLREVKK